MWMVKRSVSFEQDVTTWIFIFIFQRLERREWKVFKKEIRKVFKKKKSLRKCSRNFLTFCDQDSDNSITVEEWLACVILPGRHYLSKAYS